MDELKIVFSQRHTEYSTNFYEGIVTEQSTGDAVLYIDFYINDKLPNAITVDNIRPSFDKIDQNKIVHTSLGPQTGAADIGMSAIRWLFKEIKNFAISKGYDIKQIVSSTRYTGARAKNNPSNEIKQFDVNAKLDEYFKYNCDTDILEKTIA